MKTCKTCKYWDKNGLSSYEKTIGIGHCARAKMFWDSTGWAGDGKGRVFKDHAKHELFFVQDASDYKAYLLTMPDFGCIQHEDA